MGKAYIRYDTERYALGNSKLPHNVALIEPIPGPSTSHSVPPGLKLRENLVMRADRTPFQSASNIDQSTTVGAGIGSEQPPQYSTPEGGVGSRLKGIRIRYGGERPHVRTHRPLRYDIWWSWTIYKPSAEPLSHITFQGLPLAPDQLSSKPLERFVMARRAGTTSVASKPAGTGSVWRLFPFISNILSILLGILQMIDLNPLKLALVPFIGRHDCNVHEPHESSPDSTRPTHLPNRNTVVQGHNLSRFEHREIQNDNQAAPPAPILPALVPPTPTPRRNTPSLLGSLNGILVE
ncbi:hypothetical protein OPQ81_001217 [Rhizoctonia solani]|nr:hypothetical protein OPQ81_001217 [Rhizoctonia solani]